MIQSCFRERNLSHKNWAPVWADWKTNLGNSSTTLSPFLVSAFDNQLCLPFPFTVSEVQESERYLTIVPWSAGSLVCPQEPSPSTASSPAAEEYWHFIDTLLSFYWHFINILLSAAPHTLWLDSCRAETGSDPSGLSRQPQDSLPCSKQSQRF